MLSLSLSQCCQDSPGVLPAGLPRGEVLPVSPPARPGTGGPPPLGPRVAVGAETAAATEMSLSLTSLTSLLSAGVPGGHVDPLQAALHSLLVGAHTDHLLLLHHCGPLSLRSDHPNGFSCVDIGGLEGLKYF